MLACSPLSSCWLLLPGRARGVPGARGGGETDRTRGIPEAGAGSRQPCGWRGTSLSRLALGVTERRGCIRDPMRDGSGSRGVQFTNNKVRGMYERPTLCPDGEPRCVRVRPCARESSSPANPPQLARSHPPPPHPFRLSPLELLVFRPPPSARLRLPRPLAPRRAARPLLKRAAVHHGRGPRAPCPKCRGGSR